MVILDFENIEEGSCGLHGDPARWTDWIYDYAFYGHQIFIVGGKNFSGEFPIVGFARHLNAILYNLSKDGDIGYYEEPAMENPHFLQFSLNGKYTKVDKVNRKTDIVVETAQSDTEELAICARKYLQRVIAHFSKIVPVLVTDEGINAWLTDPSLPSHNYRI